MLFVRQCFQSARSPRRLTRVTSTAVTRTARSHSATDRSRPQNVLHTARLSGGRSYSMTVAAREPATVPIIFVEGDGTEKEVQAEIGKNLLDVAHDNDVELEGACGGELACSTCHLVFEKEIYDTLPEMEPDEEDMLDMAYELTDTSRLGCQIKVREDFAGMKVKIPDDGF